MGFRLHRLACSAALALLLAAGVVAPASGAVTVTSPVAQFVTEPGSVAKMYAALDPDAQVYLVVWSTFSLVTKGQFLNTAGRALSAPFQIASGGYARVARGANEFLVAYSKGNNTQRWGRSLKYVNGAAQMGPEFLITTATYVDADAGMVYVPAAQHYLITSWSSSNGFHSYFTGVRADGTITVPTTLVTGSAKDTASPEIACDFATAKCLIVGYGDNKYTWARYVNANTGAFLSGLFTLDSGSTDEDHSIEWNATNQRFLMLFVRNRAGIASKRIYANGTFDATPTTVISGGYGQLSMSYNSAVNSFLAAFKDSAGNNQENCWVQEFDGNGVAVGGQLKKVSTQTTAGNAAPVTVPNVSRSEYLFVQTRNYNAGDAGVLGATTPSTSTSPSSDPPPPPPPPPPTSTTLVTAAKADFNGDSKADLLWEYTSGLAALWKMNGTTAISTVLLNDAGSADPTWKIVGSGDLNGDGKPEIVWQRDNGDLCAWTMAGDLLSSWAMIPATPGSGWRVVAVADMNLDTKADLIFQQTNGSLAYWNMNGLSLIGGGSFNPATPGDANWRVVGVGDMNGDGKPDLIFRHQLTGVLVVWFMNGVKMSSWAYLTPNKAASLDWTVRAVIDLNGDGQTDLVWQHTSGTLAAWLMNGTKAVSTPLLNPSTVGAGWTIVGPK